MLQPSLIAESLSVFSFASFLFICFVLFSIIFLSALLRLHRAPPPSHKRFISSTPCTLPQPPNIARSSKTVPSFPLPLFLTIFYIFPFWFPPCSDAISSSNFLQLHYLPPSTTRRFCNRSFFFLHRLPFIHSFSLARPW